MKQTKTGANTSGYHAGDNYKIYTNFVLFLVIFCLFSFAPARASNWQWVKGAIGFGNSNTTAVAANALGEIFVLGMFDSTSVTFGTGTILNTSLPGFSDIYITKYLPDGTVVWTRGIDAAATKLQLPVALLPNGVYYLYACGREGLAGRQFVVMH
jgi:hypothetical protein